MIHVYYSFSHNVYNKVDVLITEEYAKNITVREVKAAEFFDRLAITRDLIGNIVDKDYTIGEYAFPKRLSTDSSLIPTDAFQKRVKFLSGNEHLPMLI